MNIFDLLKLALIFIIIYYLGGALKFWNIHKSIDFFGFRLRTCADINADGTGIAFGCTGNTLNAKPDTITCRTEECTENECCEEIICSSEQFVEYQDACSKDADCATALEFLSQLNYCDPCLVNERCNNVMECARRSPELDAATQNIFVNCCGEESTRDSYCLTATRLSSGICDTPLTTYDKCAAAAIAQGFEPPDSR